MSASRHIAAAFAAALAATPAIAQDAPTQDADSCVLAKFTRMAGEINAMPGVSLKLRMGMADLDAMVDQCEQETASEAVIFNGMTQFSTTIGNVTFEFK